MARICRCHNNIIISICFSISCFYDLTDILTQSISGKDAALQNLRNQLQKLDTDLDENIVKNKKLSELIATLNQQIEILNLEKN